MKYTHVRAKYDIFQQKKFLEEMKNEPPYSMQKQNIRKYFVNLLILTGYLTLWFAIAKVRIIDKHIVYHWLNK